MEDMYLNKLSFRDIKPTAIRLLILRTMMEMKRAVSMTDLEAKLDTVDKSTIFRTLSLFLSHHLIHGVDDGSGSLKYAVCEDCCMCTVEDQHTHFYCEHCHNTYCIRNVHAPTVVLPDGFVQTSINYVIKGICADCAAREKTDTKPKTAVRQLNS